MTYNEGITMRIIEVKLKNGKTYDLRVNLRDSSTDGDTNGATDDVVDLLQQLPAELLATPPRAILDR